MKYFIEAGPALQSWQHEISLFLASHSGQQLQQKLLQTHEAIFPSPDKLFRAFELTPLEKVKVVILGQDPYHTPGKADGLAFSIPSHEKLPPSLRNIFKRISLDFAQPVRQCGQLQDWACQGVLLMNPILTVSQGRALSHQKWGWETLTSRLLQVISATQPHVVFLLWGSYAQARQACIDVNKHTVITSTHPSPLSATRGDDAFMKTEIFKRCNEALVQHGQAPINWRGCADEAKTLFDEL